MNDNLKPYQGGQEIELSVDLASIPMFLRGAAILPTTEDVKHILYDTIRHLDILISAEHNVDFMLYDDDGHTEDFEKGVYAKTEISVQTGERTRIRFNTSGSYASTLESITLRLVSKQKGAYWVTVDGERIPRHIIKEAYDESETGWYYNMSDRTILVKYPLPKKADYEVVISTEKFDLIGMNED